MTKWTPETVADADDRYSPYVTALARVETPEYLLFIVPESFSLTFVRRFQCEPDRADASIEEVLRTVRSAGGHGLRWVINRRTRPPDLADRLRRRGFTLLSEAETLYQELGSEATVPQSWSRPSGRISSREVRTEEEVVTFAQMGETALGDPPPPARYAEAFRSEVRHLMETTGHSELFLAYDGETPIGRGGMSMVGIVGRLWGAGVIPDHRGKGAYSALTAARCQTALQRGAELVLTHARVGTSGPILKAHGFQVAGPYTYYQLPSIP